MSSEPAPPPRRDLTSELLDRLLERFSPNRFEAGERYNAMRVRLIQFFAWQAIDSPDDQADEVINRVARRITEGEEIPNLPGYFLGVARLVTLEARARRAREDRAHKEFARLAHGPQPDVDEPALSCLDRCLAQLAPDRRQHLLAYYSGEEGTRIATRQRLAAELGVDMGALRNRMLRARQQLEACVERCLAAQRSVRDGLAAPATENRRSAAASSGDEDA